MHKPNEIIKLIDAESFKPGIREKLELIEEKNKIHEDQVSSSESKMNEVREVFDGVRDELDQTRQIVLKKINSQYDRGVNRLEECKKQEIEKLKEFKERNEYDIAQNNQLVSFTKVTLQSAKGGSLVKEFTRGLSRRIDDANSKKPLDNLKKIKLPRLEKNALIQGDEYLLGKIHWDHDTKRIKEKNCKPEGIKQISCVAIMGILVVVIAVGMYTTQGTYLNHYPGVLRTLKANPGKDKPDIETLNLPQANPGKDKPDIEKLNTPQANFDTDTPGIRTPDRSLTQDNNKQEHQHATTHLSSDEIDPIHAIETNAKNKMDSETQNSLLKEDVGEIENDKSLSDASYRRKVESDFRHIKQNISEALNTLSPDPTDIYTNFGYRMALIKDTIWIPLFYNHSIAVITLNGIEVNRIYFPGYTDLHPNSVLQVNEVDVLLVSDEGLFVLNSTGHIQYRVAEGRYEDLSKHDDKIIALQLISHEEIRLHNLKHDTSKWNSDEEALTINKISVGAGAVTITVYGECVYISSWDYDMIYKYTLDGVLRHTYGGEGLLLGPLLSAVDHWGTVLVCDWDNDRLQTLSAEVGWREHRLGGGVVQSWDVIIMEKSIYVLWEDYENKKHRISQYSLQALT